MIKWKTEMISNEKLVLQDNERLDDLQYNNLYIIQNKTKYCFTSDAVLLANFVKAKKSDIVVDFCSGSGIVGILVYAKNNCKKMHLVEIQSSFCDMANRTIRFNGLQDKIDVHQLKVQDAVNEFGHGSVDVVVCNPPYKVAENHNVTEKQEIAMCKYELFLSLDELISSASKILKFGGKFYFVHQSNRITEIILTLKKYGMEAKKMEFCYPAQKSLSNVVLVEAVKGAKSGVLVTKTTN